MRHLRILSALLCLLGAAFGQGTIETTAGTGNCGYSGDGGQALQATLCNPQGAMVTFAGNVYFVDQANWRIRQIAPNGVITTVAGNGLRDTAGDGGLAVNASIGAISHLVTNSSILAFGDPDAHKIRFVLLSSGSIQGIGTGNPVSAGDGLAGNAVSFNQPSGIEFFTETVPPNEVATGIYVADAVDNLVRRLDGVTGIASTIVGPGTPGQLGDGGLATAASLLNPAGIRLYNNALYIADSGNNRIRKLDLSTGIISTVVGDGTAAFGGDGGPATSAQIWSPGHITFDTSGNMYFTDRGNFRVRMVDTNGIITTFAGNGTNGAGPDNVAPALTWFGGVNGVAWNPVAQGITIADGSNRIRQVLPFTPSTTTLAASPNPALPGDALTLTASVTPVAATGNVSFYNGSAVIGNATLSNGTATFSWTPSGVGTYPLKASYSGDTNYAPSSSSTVSSVVQLGTTTTGIASSQNPSSTGQAVTFTATVTPAAATGNMTFIDQYPLGGGTASAQFGIVPVVNGVAAITTSTLVAATHTIQVWYSGDARYGGGVVTFTQVVKNPTTTGLTATPNPSTYGASVSLAAQVTPASATGTVQFFNGTTLIGSASVSGGSAQIATTTLAVGTNSITASYLGDGTDSVSTSSAVVVTIGKANSTTTLSASPATPSFSQAVTLTAAVTPVSTGTVQFFNGTTLLGTATIANNQAQITTTTLPAGANSLTAAYSGDGNTNTSTSAAVQLTVAPASTTTALSASPALSSFGQSVTLSATVTPSGATGTIQFLNGSIVLGSAPVSGGHAQIATTTLPVGTNSLTAAYSGDTNYAAGTSAAVQQTVNKASSTTSLSASPSTSTFGQTVNLTATVTPATATGTVQFFNGAASLGTAAVTGGQAQLSTTALAVGAASLTAAYSGDANTATSTSSAVAATVNAAATTMVLAANPASSTYGQSVTLTATVTPSGATGSVQFLNGATVLGSATIGGGQAQLTTTALPVGTNSLTAVYGGSASYATSTSSAVQQTVAKATSATTLAASPTPTTFGQSVTLTASVTPSAATGTVQFFNGATSLGTASVSNGQAQISTTTLPVGASTLTASYSGDANDTPSTSSAVQQTVNKAAASATLAVNPSPATLGQAVTLTATIIPAGATGSVQFFNGATSLGSATLNNGQAQVTTTTLPLGADSLTASYSGDANYNSSTSAAVQETVNKAATAAALTANPSPSTFGQAVTLTAAVSPATATGTVQFFNGTTLLGTASLTAGQAQLTTAGFAAGSFSLTASYSGDANNAASTSSAFSLTVNKASTSTGITTNPAFPTVGQTVSLVATLTPAAATGAVNFFSGSTLLGTSTVSNGQATFPITATAAGLTLVNLEAVYQGSANYSPSFSATVSVNVQKGSTATAVSSSVNPSVQGQAVTFTASVAPAAATGTVTFSGIGSASVVNGIASITTSALPAGTTTVSAQYNGDSNYNPSTSVGLAQLVKTTTTTSLTSSPNASTFGQSVSLTATVTPSSATGSVQFFDGATLLGTGTLSAGHATLSISTLPAGSDSLTAVYSGDANKAPSASAVHVQTVNKASSTTKLTANPSSSSVGQTVTFTATVTPTTATGTVEFTDGSTVLATIPVNAGAAVFSTASLSAATHSLKAIYSGDTNVNTSQSSVLSYKVR